ncbi:MAG TPA: hypothetical protein VNV88_08440 [Candidatus Solibacter sp.]|nr:hypothetical protein [Candidatus Solibacter sp.]
MTLAIVVVAFVLCAIAIFFVAVRSRKNHAAQRSVDIKAFRTLMDRDDENFLRVKLSRSNFAQIKRQRIRLTWAYVARMSGNAAVVLRIGETARLSSDPRVAQEAAQAIELATQIRTQCLVAFAKMGAEFAFPSLQLTPALLVPKYESLRDTVARLASLQSRNAAPVTI